MSSWESGSRLYALAISLPLRDLGSLSYRSCPCPYLPLRYLCHRVGASLPL